MDSCVFCKIIKGELPSFKVYEDEENLAFLTIAPINPGHTLVIPKKHVSYIFKMRDKYLASLMIASKKVAVVLKETFNPRTGKIGVMIAGGEVPHAHIHLIPMDLESDLSFDKVKHDIPLEEIKAAAKKILRII